MSLRSAQDQWVAQELVKALNRVQDPSQLDSTNDVLRQKAQSCCWMLDQGVYFCVISYLLWSSLIMYSLWDFTNQAKWLRAVQTPTQVLTLTLSNCSWSKGGNSPKPKRNRWRNFRDLSQMLPWDAMSSVAKLCSLFLRSSSAVLWAFPVATDLRLCANVPSNARRLRGSMASQHSLRRNMLKA